MALIEVRDLEFSYTPEVPVLKGITLDIDSGATAIIGQNGAGKSTFVRLLNGLLKPEKGKVFVKGTSTAEVTVATMARMVGLVFQNPADQLFKNKVLDEVMFGPLNLKVPPEQAHERAMVALKQVGLDREASRNPYDLGLAERKMVTVAGVLAMDTPVVILDEPTIAQDRSGVRQLGSIVDWLKSQDRTVITITHDMEFVARYFGRVLVLQSGRVLADGTASQVFGDERLLRSAGLEPPQITSLGDRFGLGETVLTVDAFVETYSGR